MSNLEGIVAVLPTPLTPDRELDEDGLRHLVRFCAEQEFDGAVVLGSNGEFPYLSFDEKRRVMQVAAEAAAGRLPIVGTASAYAPDEALELARTAKSAGCAAVMAALPLYFAVSLERAKQHMAAVASEGGLPTYYYHFPAVTGLALKPEELEEIAAIPGIVGAKLTITSRPFLKKVIECTRKHDWKVFAGTTFLLESCLASGGAGIFCPLPLLAPSEVKALVAACRQGQSSRARQLQRRLLGALPLFSGMNTRASLQAQAFQLMSRLPLGTGKRSPASHVLVKEALRLCGHPISNAVKLPFEAASPEQSALVRRTLRELGWGPV